MKDKSKSAPLKGFFAALLLLGLAACDSIQWPHIYGPNEVPQSVMNEPREVAVPPPIPPDAPFPRLGDVPSNPKNFTPQPAIDKTKEQMENDRAAAQILKQQVETPAAAAPLPAGQ